MVGHGMEHVHVLQYRDKWWAIVNTVINCHVPYKVVNFNITYTHT